MEVKTTPLSLLEVTRILVTTIIQPGTPDLGAEYNLDYTLSLVQNGVSAAAQQINSGTPLTGNPNSTATATYHNLSR